MKASNTVLIAVPKAYAYLSTKKEKRLGGAEIQVIYLGNEFLKQGYSVHFLSADYGQNQQTAWRGLYFLNVFSFDDNSLVALWKIIRHLAAANNKLCVFRSASLQTSIVALIAKTILRKKLLYMVAIDEELQKKPWSLTHSLMSVVYRLADLVTVQTQFQYNKIEVSTDKLVLLPNILPDRKFIVQVKNKVCWVGSAIERKNVELYLSLAKSYPQEDFVLVLSKRSAVDQYWERIQEQSALIPNLEFKGQLEHQAVLTLYEKTWLYILSSENEGFSNAMMEAMQASCAVLSYIVNPDNIINKHKLGYCADGNEELFYTLFQKLRNDKSHALKMGKNAQQYITETHSPQAIPTSFWEKIQQITTDFKDYECKA